MNGDNAIPLYKYMKEEKRGILGTKGIKWNFTSFLIDKDGKVLKRYSPGPVKANDADLLKAIKDATDQK